ncbi:hypothetical protein VNO77_39128 [Canavalia gladiata]|uniref:Uncharacterized protein n=1 Tax=Canavalia gladiata TaxID=3824 RepID=A0AAN9PZH4_CANGL
MLLCLELCQLRGEGVEPEDSQGPRGDITHEDQNATPDQNEGTEMNSLRISSQIEFHLFTILSNRMKNQKTEFDFPKTIPGILCEMPKQKLLDGSSQVKWPMLLKMPMHKHSHSSSECPSVPVEPGAFAILFSKNLPSFLLFKTKRATANLSESFPPKTLPKKNS